MDSQDSKFFIFIVTVYYYLRIQIKISKRKRHMGEVQEKLGISMWCLLPV